ncbi:MAG: hypothetical protein RLZZ306_1551 [Bacteroidota bacterium]|jgi:hypothetical protein
MKRILYLSLIIVFILSCGKSELEEVLIDPKNANEVAKIILTPDGGETKQGTPPATTTTAGTLVLNTKPDVANNGTQSSPTNQVITAAQGASINLDCYYVCSANNCNSLRANLKATGTPYCIYQIKGSDSYKVYPYPSRFGNSGTLQFPFTLPENIGNGTFSVEFSIVDEYGLVTNYNTATINVARKTSLNAEVGNGTFEVNGQTLNGTAQCDLAISGYSDVDFIAVINGTSVTGVYLYNMKAGTNVIKSVNTININTDPWFAYVTPNGKIYPTQSGTATKANNKVTFSGNVGEGLTPSSTFPIRGVINCK